MRTKLQVVTFAVFASLALAQTPSIVATVFTTTLGEQNVKTPEVSTEALRGVLADGSALVLDARPHMEWATSHIPGALNVAPKPGVSMSQYVSDTHEIERLVQGEKGKALVLYCNGPMCGKSKRLSEDLLKEGFTNVRRYQLGAPVWRALGEVMETEGDGAKYVYAADRTARWVDARDRAAFAAASLDGAVNITLSDVAKAKDDGRLPMEDHNTRVIVFGESASQARTVAQEIAKNAFHNVSYYPGSYEQLRAALR
ncbi:rhodanese-like domain-containing protein [Deinococcus yavapaiensis]|uniref:Rhodanese-related sulfurtransferase n=1 Tax=Deinococcus yavapaiensis KR-236 TaxID=694435 RepID=A0A318S526_9DEIO|nr:rhodanese-like domain-containing protein [Deinococcus yavapaiensis]PYE52705.1 rhodanese-related sulfurtransferase [Deinococcus yavapaiensis KR-236]